MKLHTSDLLIICAYLIAMIVIGLILKKRAAQNMDSYFLGGKSLPFYMLGRPMHPECSTSPVRC